MTNWVGTSRGRQLAVAYLAGQATLAVVWWVALLTLPSVRELFELSGDRRSALDAFLLGDLIVFVGGSAWAASTIARRSRWATLATAGAAGGVAYATLYLAGWVAIEGTAVAGMAPMVAALVVTAAIAVGTLDVDPEQAP